MYNRRIFNLILIALIVISAVGVACLSRQHLQSYHAPDDGTAQVAAPPAVDNVPAIETDGANGTAVTAHPGPEETDDREDAGNNDATAGKAEKVRKAAPEETSIRLPQSDLKLMTGRHPFAAEAAKVLGGRLQADDSLQRRMILNYCEHLRTAYTGKDIDFVRQVFSDDALIIVGQMVKTSPDAKKAAVGQAAVYSVRTKKQYIERLAKVFASNDSIDLQFSDFSIMHHPTKKGIYGVTLRQGYRTDRYSDEGVLFLLWDFGNPSMPLIHVRTWQPLADLEAGAEAFDLGDFSIE